MPGRFYASGKTPHRLLSEDISHSSGVLNGENRIQTKANVETYITGRKVCTTVRSVTFVITPPDGGLTEADRRVGETSGVTRESVHHLNLLADGTVVGIFEIGGDSTTIDDILSTTDKVLRYTISETRQNCHVYVHFEPNDTVATLLAVTHDYELVIVPPMVATRRGGLRVTLIGDDETFRAALPEVPDKLRLNLERLGDYQPTISQRLFSMLTERQQEIFQKAVQEGYYEEPRRATHQDLAETLDCSGATVGEHLRRIEEKLFTEICP